MTRDRDENAHDLTTDEAIRNIAERARRDTVTRYSVENGSEWAEFMVSNGQSQKTTGRPNNWVSVAIRSSFGSWGHEWPAIGVRDWREFLPGMDIDYAMGKFAGDRLTVEDLDATLANVREYTESLREFPASITAAQAEDYLETYSDGEFDDVRSLMDSLSSERGNIFDGCWEMIETKRAPGIDAFWEKLWVPFCARLTSELEAERNGPQPVDWRDMDIDDDDPGIQEAIDTAAREAADAALARIGMTREDGPDVPILANQIEEEIGNLMWSVRGRERDAEAVREAEEEGFGL